MPLKVLFTSAVAAMAISPFDVIFNDLTIRGFSIGNPAFAGLIPHAIRAAGQMIAAGEVSVPIAATYPPGTMEVQAPPGMRWGRRCGRRSGPIRATSA